MGRSGTVHFMKCAESVVGMIFLNKVEYIQNMPPISNKVTQKNVKKVTITHEPCNGYDSALERKYGYGGALPLP